MFPADPGETCQELPPEACALLAPAALKLRAQSLGFGASALEQRGGPWLRSERRKVEGGQKAPPRSPQITADHRFCSPGGEAKKINKIAPKTFLGVVWKETKKENVRLFCGPARLSYFDDIISDVVLRTDRK